MDRFRIASTRPRTRRGVPSAAAALLLAVLLAGCGQKGPLWVPGHSKNTPWPMKPAGNAGDATAPAPPADTPAPPAPKDDTAKTPQARQ